MKSMLVHHQEVGTLMIPFAGQFLKKSSFKTPNLSLVASKLTDMRRKVKGAYVDSLGFDVIDQWGRMVPDPVRWPSSRDGKGFAQVAKKVHNMGLKFGIHVMRGISTQAFDANTPILDVTTGKAYEEDGQQWHAKDIGIKERACAWMKNGFMSVNTESGAGRAFLRSLYQQYAEWGVDFVKHDCVFGEDLDLNEITYVSKVLTELNRPILYSLSPGSTVTPAMARDVSGLANMYRITGDDWDTWGDVASHFDISRDLSAADMVGAKGLQGKSWPDLDMLPLGWLTDPGSNDGPYRKCKLNLDEQRTQVTLWAMAKSPFIDEDVTYGHGYEGKVHLLRTKTTEACLGASPNRRLTSKESKRGSFSRCGWDANQMWELTHNGTLMNSYSGLCASMRKLKANSGSSGIRAWVATGRGGEIYVAIFNLEAQSAEVSMRINEVAKALSW
ncbi:alpha-galactosidase mel1 [Phtheirospermum japonicum]|uniref:Alpha-galactosidase mel1 n=1 Tax=Phtheirospermum japonicum TaxID=374723 RepID=A0A830CVQ2_9LAMI|nr:alpha-galactosidase mel1 [Phtheirospermum japonicum]